MDNRVFNVNGHGLDQLRRTLELVLIQSGWRGFASWAETSKGLVLYWTDNPHPNAHKLLGTVREEIASMVLSWLSSDFAKSIELSNWDADCDHDGHNSEGWRVFCDGWGHVDGVAGSSYAICCITPAYMWHGK